MPLRRRILVGLFVAGGFFLFALGLFWIGDRRLLFSESIELQTEFANLGGLKPGSKVMVSGMDAGEILSIQVPGQPGGRFRLRFRVLSRFQPMLRSDSVASIQMEGLVGSKVLQIESGSEKGSPLASGATLPSREPLEIAAVIQQGVDLVKKVNVAVDDVQQRLVGTIEIIDNVGERAERLVINVGADAEEVFRTGKKVARDIDSIVDGAKAGRGTVGRLLNDDQLYESARRTAAHVEAAVDNANSTAESVRRIAGDIESRKLGENIEKTTANLKEATSRVNDILATLKPPAEEGRRGLLDDVRETLTNTREATGDLAENMEALKRNWLFRGYFSRRGFYDLDSLSMEDYRQGKVAPERERQYSWLHFQDLFARDREGREVLTASGRARLDEAMAPYLRHAPNTLLVVEGYSGEGTEQQQFLLSRERARTVRGYLIERFGLKPNYTGAVPMGAVSSEGPVGRAWEGVALVLLTEKKK